MLKIYVVTHDWENGESVGSNEVEYFSDPITAEEFRQNYIKYWKEKRSSRL